MSEFSSVKISILAFAALTLVEAWFIIVGSPIPPTFFASLFVVNLALRVRLASHKDAECWWPIAPTLLATILIERTWTYRKYPLSFALSQLWSSLTLNAFLKGTRAIARSQAQLARSLVFHPQKVRRVSPLCATSLATCILRV